jgi:hypothetical protein
MASHRRKFWCLLPITCGIAFGYQQDAERDKDVYLIYSLMLTNPQTSHGPDNNARYLIAATTGPGVPKDPCVRPPKERETEFREVLADFEHRKAAPRQLRRDLSIQKPYLLLSADEVKAFTDARDSFHAPPQVPDERFRDVADVFTLTDVYFNPHRTLALTAIGRWCGNLCGLWQWKVFEKLDTGRWQELDWTACATMARR